jgi:adenylate kinase family enzyme
MSIGCGYNLSMEFVHAHEKAYNTRKMSKDALMTQLSAQNEQLKELSRFINALVQRKESGKADFHDEPEFMDLIDRIREAHIDPRTGESIIPAHQYKWDTEKEIETVLQVLNDHVKIIAQDVNQTTMLISQDTQDTIQLTEISYKTIDMLIRHIESILAKYRR